MKRLLILGSGFISKFVAEEAVLNNIEPVVLYRKHPLEESETIKQYCLSSIDLSSFLSEFKPDYIIALQGTSFVPDNRRIVEAMDSNLMLIISFLDRVMSLVEDGTISPEKVVLTGSAAEYGKNYHEPISEDFPLHPTSIYGLTKIFLYNTALYYHEKGLPVVYARQFNCTGAFQRDVFVVPSICRQIALIEKGAQEGISIGDTSQERDFIDVRDAARGYLTLLEKGVPGEVYNIASGRAVSIGYVLEKALSLAHKEKEIPVRSNPRLFVEKNALSNRICADVTKMSSLGFAPTYTLDETVKFTLDFWRARV